MAAQSILVPEGSAITSYQDLLDGSYTAGVQLGTTGDIMATEKLGDRVSQYEKYGDALAKANNLVVLEEPFGGEEDAEYYGIAVSKDNTELLDKINAALADMTAEGFFDELNEKYAG